MHNSNDVWNKNVKCGPLSFYQLQASVLLQIICEEYIKISEQTQ